MRDSIIDRVAMVLYQHGVQVQQGENEEGCFLLGAYPARNASFKFMLWNAKSSITAIVVVLEKAPPEKQEAVLRELNRLNSTHQWVRFVLLEETNDVQAVYDFPTDYKIGKALDMDYAFDHIGGAVTELVEFLVICADEAYPKLMEILRS